MNSFNGKINLLKGTGTNFTHSFTNAFLLSFLPFLPGRLVPLIGTHQLRPSPQATPPSAPRPASSWVMSSLFLARKMRVETLDGPLHPVSDAVDLPHSFSSPSSSTSSGSKQPHLLCSISWGPLELHSQRVMSCAGMLPVLSNDHLGMLVCVEYIVNIVILWCI